MERNPKGEIYKMDKFLMYVPTRALFGAGELNNLHKQALPGRRAMLVISNGKSARTNGSLARTEEQLTKAGVAYFIFDKVEANPLKSTVMEGGAFAREHGCDFVVALGGGSVMDASKAIALMATNGGDLWDYVQSGTGGRKTPEHDPLPIVAITTTAGTGSETDSGGVITNPETHEKTGIVSEKFFPAVAIVDPELMTSVPPKFTAYQGFDALFHSTEGYISNKANLMSDMVAITAIENVGRNLAATVRDGMDMEARAKVAFGNYLSGIQMCVGCCTSEHSLEHAMSAYHQELPHGAGLIIISLAYYDFFIKKGAAPERFVRMARAMGMEDAAKPEDFLTALAKLQRECGVDGLKMSDYGITPDEFEKMAKNAMDSMCWLFANDPVEISVEDCIEIYKKSYR